MTRLRPLAVLAAIALLGAGLSACADVTGPTNTTGFCTTNAGSGTCEDDGH